MRKAVALLVVFVLVIGCTAAFAAQTTQTTEKKSAIRTFFQDLKNLLTKKIPETPQQKSDTYRMFDRTEKPKN